MKRIKLTALLTAAFYAVFSFSQALAAFSFSDTRFQNVLTTENLDAIIEEYELYDGWYWTTQADIPQTFHGHPECPGWTTTVDRNSRKAYQEGWYGCRWPIDHVRKAAPDRGGYAECFAYIVRVEYRKSGHEYYHSAVVYEVNGEEIVFLQVSGGSYNRISIGKGFSDGNVENVTSIEELSVIPGLKISRYHPE